MRPITGANWLHWTRQILPPSGRIGEYGFELLEAGDLCAANVALSLKLVEIDVIKNRSKGLFPAANNTRERPVNPEPARTRRPRCEGHPARELTNKSGPFLAICDFQDDMNMVADIGGAEDANAVLFSC